MTVAAISPRLHDLIAPDAELEEIASGCVFTEGPLWVAAQRTLYFSDMPDDCRRKWSDADGVTEVARPSNKGNGMTLRPRGPAARSASTRPPASSASSCGRLAHRRSRRTTRARS